MANIKTITNPVLIRLAHKAGVKRLSGPLYAAVRSVLLEELRDCLKNVVTYTETARRKTVQIDDVSSALGVYSSHASNRRYPQYNKQTSSDETTRKINHKPGTVVNRDIRRLQKQYNCLYIPKLTFETLVRNIVSEYADGFRLQEKAVVLLQHYTENMLLKLFRTANHVATSAGRQTLQPEDVKLVRYITRSLSNVGAPLLLAQAKFRIYIYKTLKKVHPKMSISANVNEQLNHALNLLGNRLAERATHLTSVNNKRTLSEREVKSAVRIVFSGELAKHAVKEGQVAVEKYTSSKGANKSKSKKEPTSAASRAGLVFPPSRARKLLANRTTQMGETASVFLAAVLEYVSAEVLELSGNAASDNKRSTIQARHLQSAVEGDKELSTLAASIGFEVVGGGVVKESDSADSEEEADEDADSDVDSDVDEDGDNLDDAVSDDEDESDKKSSKKATKGTKGKKTVTKKGTKSKKSATKKGTKGTKGKGKKVTAKKATKGTKGTKSKKSTVKKGTKSKKNTKSKKTVKKAKGKKGTKSKKTKSK
jgi:histone H2A